jgi:hypothetical protein
MEKYKILNYGRPSESDNVCYQANYHSLKEICFWWFCAQTTPPPSQIVAKFIIKPKIKTK